MEKWFAGSMKERYKKFYMMFDKRFKNLILCSNTLCDGGIRKGFSVDQDQSEKESFPTYPHKNI